jgi:hypothetical protein
MKNNGRDLASWSTTQGTHTMTITMKITAAPHDVVTGQIHDANDDVTVVRLIGNALWATDGDDTTGSLIDPAYVLGTEFQIQMVASGGQIKTYYNGVLKQTLTVSTSACYFKAGTYHQSNGSGSAVAEVKIAALTVTHA